MTDLVDKDQRIRIETEFDTTFFVEAAAGAGKTTALVGRIVAMILRGRGSLATTVAVTFTEKAAGEMKLRLRLEIERARSGSKGLERARLDQALEELELARIGTIHSFCADILRERPIEAGVDPIFKLLAEGEDEALMDVAFDRWLQKMLSDPPEGVRRTLGRKAGRDTSQAQLRGAVRQLCEHRDFPTAWRRDPFDRHAAIDDLVEELSELGALINESAETGSPLFKHLQHIDRVLREATRLEMVGTRDYDRLEGTLRDLQRLNSWTHKGFAGSAFGDLSDIEVKARRDAIKVRLDAVVAACEADLAPLLQQELRAAVDEYEVAKAELGALDFLDLLIKTRDLVRGNEAVRADLQRRFSHFFVDEFQDTDPLQAEILLLLAADDAAQSNWMVARPVDGKLFLVGDPKQSIYRFRRADVVLYEDVKQRLLKLGAELLPLTSSFRSPPSLQRLVNTAFERPISEDPDAGGYVPLANVRPEISGRPTTIALSIPEPYSEYGKVTAGALATSSPDVVAAFVDWLVNRSGWTVEENKQQVPVRPRHVAMLFRRVRNFGSDVTRPYLRALEARSIPHVLVGGRSFHDREEVVALRTALAAIEWPDDELQVFATLRGPFFAIGDEALLVFRRQIGPDDKPMKRRLDPTRKFDRTELDPAAYEVADALEILRDLHRGRNRRPIAQTITMLLEAVRAHAGIALWMNGEQALANCQRLVDQARRFEGRASSFRSFVERLEQDADRGEVDDAPIIEEGTDGVRAMTVYKAKGLDFPVVILVDPTYRSVRQTADKHIDSSRSLWLERLCGAAPIELQEANTLELNRDRAEAVRVAYVAATRARDLLVIPACGEGPIEGWLDTLNPVIYPPEGMHREGQPAEGCPAFGEDSVRTRPKGKARTDSNIKPGLYPSIGGGPPVAWWDPATLEISVEDFATVRHQRLLERPLDGDAEERGREAFAAWESSRRKLIGRASQPAHEVRTATAHAAVATDASVGPVRVERLERADTTGSFGARFGTLVHAVLAMVPLSADRTVIERLAGTQGKAIGAPSGEVLGAIATVEQLLLHPTLKHAATLDQRRVYRETPIHIQLVDGTLIEGVVDLAFENTDSASWTVVDFKTVRDVDAVDAVEQYKRQVDLYCQAIRTATGVDAKGIVLVV